MKYFELNEFFDSPTATKNNIRNKPPTSEEAKVLKNLTALADKVLDPVREQYGKPIKVSSGYRCVELNRLVGGVPTSQHVKGEAVDLVCDDNKRLFDIIKGLEFDQLIWERGGAWVHVSYKRSGNNRKQILYK